MKLSSVQQTEQAEQAKYLLLAELREHQMPMSLQELGLNLGGATGTTKLSHRTLKEAAWGLVEEGRAKFNATWDLEIL